uniref:Uncharacterized protein n=1 Tax=viral metagenome TaxID=1070528 RepID=A0A6C0KV67_9ZZZZ
MESTSLPTTLLLIGAVSSIALQTQKIAILESKSKPTAAVNSLITSALNFANFIIFFGILLIVLDHYKALPPQVKENEDYVLVAIGAVIVLIAGAILAQKNTAGKVGSIQLALIGIITCAIGTKNIVDKKFV